MIDYTKSDGKYFKVIMHTSYRPDEINWSLREYTFYRLSEKYLELEYDNGDSGEIYHIEYDKKLLEQLKETPQEAIQDFVNKLQLSVDVIKRYNLK